MIFLKNPLFYYLPLDAPEHVGNAHVVVVDDVSQVIRGEAVRLEDDRVALEARHNIL